jgi:hypothetical protein
MGGEDAATITEFEAALAAVPEVRHAERLFGDPDCLLRITAADLPAYAALGDEALATLPGVQRLTSTIVMKRAVDDRPLPLSPDAAHLPQRPSAPQTLNPAPARQWQGSRPARSSPAAEPGIRTQRSRFVVQGHR